MTEIFEDEEKTAVVEEEILALETDDDTWSDFKASQGSDARRKLESLLDEKRLKEDLDDYFELEDL